MPKKPKPKLVLPKAQDVASAKTLAAELTKCEEAWAKAKAAATQEGKLNKYDAKYRLAHKRLKRAERALHRELVRVTPRHAPKAVAAAAPAAPAAPAEEKKA